MHTATLSRRVDLNSLRARFGLLLLMVISTMLARTVAAAPEDPWEGGQWGPVINWPHVPVSAANLPDGRVLTWSGSEQLTWPTTEQTYSATWDPSSGQFLYILHSGHNMFCSHLAMTKDGRVFANGGRNQTNSPWTSIFDYQTNTWQMVQNMALNGGRWYPTTVALPDGKFFTAIGTATNARYPEVYDPASGWALKNGIDFNAMVLAPYSSTHGERNWWPLLHVAPDGQIFHSGPTPGFHWIDPEGGQNGEGTFNTATPTATSDPIDWYHKHGTTVMYDEGKLLTAGGWIGGQNSTSTNKAFTVDLRNPSPQVNVINPMNFARKYHNGVMLPNGKVLIVGGNTSGVKFSDSGSILATEIWDPATGQWSVGAEMSVPRNYHSVALLLTDGTVYSGGGGYCSGNPTCNGATHPDAQIYSPPYLFNTDGSVASRPQISTGPTQIVSGQDFAVSATAEMQKFSLIKMSSTTHGVNTDLRYLDVPFVETSAGSYTLTPHANPNVLTSGYWMLFALDANGVPSEAHVLQANAGNIPSMDFIADQFTAVGEAVSLQAVATDPDGDPLTYSATGLPPGLNINSNTGLISGFPAAEGTFAVSVTATDTGDGSAVRSFTWTVYGTGLGLIKRDWWTGIAGTSIADLTSDPGFPDSPSGESVLTSFEAPVDFADNYGTRIYGYLEPDVSGLHTFWISSDDNGELWLSTDTDPANKALIATVPGWSASREWTKYPQQQSAPIDLVAGTRYYIEALQKEGGGGDNLAVAWQRPGDAGPAVIPGINLSTEPTNEPPATLADTVSTGVVTDVGSNWETVGLPRSYTNPVVVVSVQYDGSNPPAVPRVRNAGGSSFDVKVQNPSDVPLSGYTISYIAVEAGTYDDGQVKFEAGHHLSTVTDAKKSWNGEMVPYQQAYASPVVLGQVMTANDPLWSVFWAASQNRRLPPDATDLVIGKHVGEDPNKVRSNETLGYIVVEAGTGFFGDLAYEAGVGPKTVEDLLQPAAPYLYALSSDFTSATISTAGMEGGNGGWPLLYGTVPLAGGSLAVAYDEDQVKDGERGHAAEHVAYIALSGDIIVPLEVDPISVTPEVMGSVVTYSVTASRSGLEYSFSYGDGTPPTAFSTDPNGQHTYAAPGRYVVVITVRDPATGEEVVETFVQLIHAPLTANRPSQSASILVDAYTGDVWSVNPDNNTVTIIDGTTNTVLAEMTVGAQPVSIAQTGTGNIWVANKRSASISVIDNAALTVVNTINLDSASHPHGIAISPVANVAYVALEGTGDLIALDAATGSEINRSYLGRNIRHVSVAADGSYLLVSRFITPPLPNESTAVPILESGGVFYGGDVMMVDASTLGIQSSIPLRRSVELASEHAGPGVPNYLGPAVISPDGLAAWVPSKQDNILAGGLRGGTGMTFDQTVRAIASKIDLQLVDEVYAARVDFDNSGIAKDAAFDNYGAYLFTSLESSREVTVVDAYSSIELLSFDVGRAPQGLALSSDGNKLYVQNFMDRTVGIYDISKITQENVLEVTPIDIGVPVVSSESLSAEVFLGKQLFYDARDPKLALDSYMSCATCHSDGGNDGRVWDFTDFGEGLRNTATLQGKGGMAHGFLHWSANFDEVQDFEFQIRNFAGGAGLMSDAEFFTGSRQDPLGDPKAGVSADLDALAAYVSSLISVPDSPYRNADATLTPDGELGLAIFERENCAQCHAPVQFTDSGDETAMHDVGTIKPSSGGRLGGPLTGVDTPTLVGAWATSPYLHDGSANDLSEAVAAHTLVGITLTTEEAYQLASYLEQIDDATRGISNVAPDSPVQAGTVSVDQVNGATWHSVTFAPSFSVAPVIAMGSLSFQDGDPANIRVRNVTPAGFEFQIDEWDYLDGVHGLESVAWIAVEAGVHDFGGITVEAGIGSARDRWNQFILTAPFATPPVVLAQIVTTNDAAAAALRMKNVLPTSFAVRIEEEELADGSHADESIHYIAFSTGSGTVNGNPIKVGSVALTEIPNAVNFGGIVPTPAFFASVQTRTGGDMVVVRHSSLLPSQATIFLEEETSKDAEVQHNAEEVGWVVVTGQ